MRPFLPSLFAVAVLAACSQPAENEAPPVDVAAVDAAPAPGASESAGGPAATTTAPTALGGVDLTAPLRVTGTEPFWGVSITSSSVSYDGVDRPMRTGPNPGPSVAGTTAVYEGSLEGAGAYTLTLTATECSDGMSDRVYPLAARFQVGGETLNGCAASQAFFDASRP